MYNTSFPIISVEQWLLQTRYTKGYFLLLIDECNAITEASRYICKKQIFAKWRQLSIPYRIKRVPFLYTL